MLDVECTYQEFAKCDKHARTQGDEGSVAYEEAFEASLKALRELGTFQTEPARPPPLSQGEYFQRLLREFEDSIYRGTRMSYTDEGIDMAAQSVGRVMRSAEERELVEVELSQSFRPGVDYVERRENREMPALRWTYRPLNWANAIDIEGISFSTGPAER